MTAGTVTEEELIGCLSIKTIAAADGLAAGLLTSEEVLAPLLAELTERGVVAPVAGAFQLTESGLARAEELQRDVVAGWGAEAASAALDDFLPLDQRMKSTVTAWQLREVGGEQTLNDHTDEDYDTSVLLELAALHTDTSRWLTSLGEVSRFPAYLARFDRAMAAVKADDTRYVASRVDSYHSVWFELHEDLIRLAGRTREDEVAAGRA